MRKTLVAVTMLLLMLLGSVGVAYAASSVGTITVVTECALSSPKLLSLAEADVNATALTVDTKYHVNVTVSDTDGLDDIEFVWVQAWLESEENENATSNENTAYWFWWNGSDTSFYDLPEGFLDDANCHGSASAAITQYEFCFQWDYSKVAKYSNGANAGWSISIWANDTEGNSAHLAQADTNDHLVHGIAEYMETTDLAGTHSWASLAQGSSNNPVSGNPLTFTAIANRAWDATAKANNTYARVQGDSYVLGIDNITVYSSNDAVSSNPLVVDPSEVVIGPALENQGVPATEAGTACDLYMWVDIPPEQPPGAYVYELIVTTKAHS